MGGLAFSIEHMVLVLMKVVVIRGLSEVGLTYRLAETHRSNALAS